MSGYESWAQLKMTTHARSLMEMQQRQRSDYNIGGYHTPALPSSRSPWLHMPETGSGTFVTAGRSPRLATEASKYGGPPLLPVSWQTRDEDMYEYIPAHSPVKPSASPRLGAPPAPTNMPPLASAPATPREIVTKPLTPRNLDLASKPSTPRNVEMVTKPLTPRNVEMVTKPLTPRNVEMVAKPLTPRAAGNNVSDEVENALNSRFSNMRRAFKWMDLDNSGSVGRPELKRALELWNIPNVETVLDGLMAVCDVDDSGQVDYKEFVDALARDKAMRAVQDQVYVKGGTKTATSN